MHIYEQHLVCIYIMTRHTKKHWGTKLSLQQEVCHFDSKFPFHPHSHTFSMPCTNKLLLQIEHHSLPIHSVSLTLTFNMKSCQKLSPTWDMVGVMVPSIFMHCHEGLTPYNFQIQFPMFVVFHILHFSILLRIFFSDWWWKVYDRKPQMRIPLSKLWKTHVEIQQLVLFMAGFTMLSDISPTARENTACDMDEVLWPDRNRRQDATCNCSKCNTEQKKKA